MDDFCTWYLVIMLLLINASLGNDCVSYFVEWIEGSPNLNGSDFNLLWIYLVFMNGLWVVVPLLLLWDSFARISNVRTVLRS